MSREIKKIAFINPNNPLNKENPALSKMFTNNADTVKQWAAPALSILTIAGLTPDSIEMEYIDERYEKINFEVKYDLVGLTAMTHQANRAYEIASVFKKKNIPVVMGGIHASILPEEAIKHVDSVFIGEAEDTWLSYLNDLKSGTEKQFYKGVIQPNIEKSPIPRYDLIKFKLFKDIKNYFNFIPVQATRGCPHDCNFCVATKYYGKKIRKKTINQVVKEIQYMQSINKEILVFFADDNLFVDRKYCKELLKAIIPLHIKFFAQTDVKFAEDEELLKLAYLSGCEMVFIGFESINLKSLDEVNQNKWKMNQVKNYSEAIRRIQFHGIVAFGGFIIGFDHDDSNTFNEIKEFVVNNNIPGSFTLLTPLPGSRLIEELKAQGRLYSETSWDKCAFYSLIFKHPNLKNEDAENSLVWLYSEVYTQENSIKRFIHMKNIYKNLPPRWIYQPL